MRNPFSWMTLNIDPEHRHWIMSCKQKNVSNKELIFSPHVLMLTSSLRVTQKMSPGVQVVMDSKEKKNFKIRDSGCGCTGSRSCLVCEEYRTDRFLDLTKASLNEKRTRYFYCPDCGDKAWKSREHSQHDAQETEQVCCRTNSPNATSSLDSNDQWQKDLDGEELNVRHFMSTILIPRFSVQVLVDISSQQTCCSNQIEDRIKFNLNIKQILVIFG